MLTREPRLRGSLVREDRAQDVWHHAGVEVLAHLERDFDLLLERWRHVLGHQALGAVAGRERREVARRAGGAHPDADTPRLQRFHQRDLGEAAWLRNRIAEEDGRLVRGEGSPHGDRMRAVCGGAVGGPADLRLRAGGTRRRLIDEAHVRGGRSRRQHDRVACGGARADGDVDQVVIDRDG